MNDDKKVQDQPNEDEKIEQSQEQESQEPQESAEKSEESGRSAIEKAIDDMGIDEEDQTPANKDEPKAQEGTEQDSSDTKTQKAAPDAAKEKEQPQKQEQQSPEQEEAEIVKGIASERGRQRITQLLREGREARSGLESVRRMVSESGLDQESFGNLLTITKLCSSDKQEDVTKGLAMLEGVRNSLYRQLGREAPGVDLLAEHKDLQERVKSMGLNRDDALAIARGRKAEADRQAAIQQHAQEQQQAAEYQQKMQTFQSETIKAFSAHQHDLDFNARIEVLKKHFTPQKIQEFVHQIPPEHWKDVLVYMYESAGDVMPKPTAPRSNPIVGQAARATGVRVSKNMSATPEGIAARIEEMGL